MDTVLDFNIRTRLKKLLYSLPVIYVRRLKALAVMKNKSWIVVRNVWKGNIRPSSTIVCDIDVLI